MAAEPELAEELGDRDLLVGVGRGRGLGRGGAEEIAHRRHRDALELEERRRVLARETAAELDPHVDDGALSRGAGAVARLVDRAHRPDLERPPAPERDVLEAGRAARDGVDEHGALGVPDLGERVGDGRARIERARRRAHDLLRPVQVADGDVVEPRRDGRRVAVAHGADAEAALALAGDAAGHVLVEDEQVDGVGAAMRGARVELGREAPSVARAVGVLVGERGVGAAARDARFGEERHQPGDDGRAGARDLDAHHLGGERLDAHAARTRVVAAEHVVDVAREDDAEAPRQRIGGGEARARVVVAGDGEDGALAAVGEAVDELEEEILGPRRRGEGVEHVAGEDRRGDVEVGRGGDELLDEGALLGLARQLPQPPAEVEVRDVQDAHVRLVPHMRSGWEPFQARPDFVRHEGGARGYEE